MNIVNWLKGRYRTHSQAVIVSCFYNPTNSPYRLAAFNRWYETIKHMPHMIAECLIGGQAESQLPDTESIIKIRTPSLLWHKEALLNRLIKGLPDKFRYVFWVDADVIFLNPRWLIDSVRLLQTGTAILQPFKYCTHMEKDQETVDKLVLMSRHEELDSAGFYEHDLPSTPVPGTMRTWRSFGSNYGNGRSWRNNYDQHGHVGFAWAARREVLDRIPLFDKGLIGGADHVIAHAAASHIPHTCIRRAFADDIEAVVKWSYEFRDACVAFSSSSGRRVGFVKGDLLHIWHGELKDRQYAQRVKEFTGMTKNVHTRDANGLFVTDDLATQAYTHSYFQKRDVIRGRPDNVTRRTAPRNPITGAHPASQSHFMEDAVAFGAGALVGAAVEHLMHPSPPAPGHGGDFGGGGAGDSDGDAPQATAADAGNFS